MKLAESGLELVACGSSGAYMPTFGTWEKTVLTKLTRISLRLLPCLLLRPRP